MNPFLTTNYIDDRYFCDREYETQEIITALSAGRSITLHAIRRIGKTGLIKHIFYQLNKADEYICIYVDIYDTNSDQELLEKLINAVLRIFESQETLSTKIFGLFARYRPRLIIDSITGNPSIELDIAHDERVGPILEILFRLLKEQTKTVIIAVDEFQQIENYQNSGIAATIRELLQSHEDVRFIFSGSQKNLLLNLFTSPKKALFRSTQLMALDKIDDNIYAEFIRHHFKQGLKTISNSVVKNILTWTDRHTYYTQYFCNRLYSLEEDVISTEIIERVKRQILKENEVVFYNYRNLLTKHQWGLLVAIAKESTVIEITSKDFIQKYELGAHSTVRSSLQFLLTNELIYSIQVDDEPKPIYHIYDPFLLRWIQSK